MSAVTSVRGHSIAPILSHGRNRRGVALVLVLWLLVVLGLASLQILALARSRLDMANLARSRVVSRYAAESGVVAARELLEQMLSDATSPLDQARVFGDFEREVEAWGPRRLETARFQVVVEDLNARVDLNASSPPVLQGLLRQFVSDAAAEELVRALRGGETGAEALDDTASAVASGPRLRSGSGQEVGAPPPLMRLEELSRVPGFGDTLAAALAPYVTVWSDGLIDVNAAPVEVLAAVPYVGDVAARSLVSAREGSGALASKVAVYSELSQRSARPVDSRLTDLVTVPRRVLIVSRGWESGHPYTHEIQAVFEVLSSRLVTGSRVRLRFWTERGR